MPLDVRSIAIKLAVLAFFAVCVVGVFYGVPTETCTKRGCLAAVSVYFVSRLTVHGINSLLVQAMMSDWMRKSEAEKGLRDQ